MKFSKSILLVPVLAIFASGVLSAAQCPLTDINATLNYSANGCFNLDSNEQSFIFTLASNATVNAYTTSWATAYAPTGLHGFEPILTLYTYDPMDGSGTYIDSDTVGGDAGSGTCGLRGTDPTEFGSCLDSYLTESLVAGSYRLVLTEWDNIDQTQGDYSAAAFSHYNGGNFTGAGGFHDSLSSAKRSNNWAVTIATVTDSPEPTTWLLLASGLVGSLVVQGRRRSATGRL